MINSNKNGKEPVHTQFARILASYASNVNQRLKVLEARIISDSVRLSALEHHVAMLTEKLTALEAIRDFSIRLAQIEDKIKT